MDASDSLVQFLSSGFDSLDLFKSIAMKDFACFLLPILEWISSEIRKVSC